MMGVYKVTNITNQTAYIGIAFDIDKRWIDHKILPFKNIDKNKNKFYNAIRKYKLENFTFEVIEECKKEKLREREIYWIAHYDAYYNGYNSTKGGDIGGYDVQGENHPNVKITKNDVEDIRTRYSNLERRMDVYELYKDKISLSGFIKVWQGGTWKNIMTDVYTKENKEFHSKNSGMVGSKNGRAKTNEKDVYEIRLRKSNGETLKNVYNGYSEKFSYAYFKHIWYGGVWKNIVVN